MNCYGKDRRLILPIGSKCNSWTVIGELVEDKGFYKQLCRCDCGNTLLIEPTRLNPENKKTRIQCRKCWGAWTTEEDDLLRNNHDTNTSYEPPSVPGRSEIAVNKRRMRLGIPSRFHLDRSITIDDLDNVTLQLLLGIILGDGSITLTTTQKGKCRDYHFEEEHHDPQNDYTFWTAQNLSIFHAKANQRFREDKGVLVSKLRTKNHKIFTDLRPLIYPDDESAKYFIPDIFHRLDLLGLMKWYLDDGSNSRSTQLIAAKGWKWSDLIALCDVLNLKYGLSLYVKRVFDQKPGENKNVYIPAATRDIVFPVWQQYAKELGVPDCMLYKLELSDTKFTWWTVEEDDILCQNQKATKDELLALLPRRNARATQHRRQRLGLTERHEWTAQEDKILRRPTIETTI